MANAPAIVEARLITSDEYQPMVTTETYETPTAPGTRYVPLYDWSSSSDYMYWTMSQTNDSTSRVQYVSYNGGDGSEGVYGSSNGYMYIVRPVIVLSKSLISA